LVPCAASQSPPTTIGVITDGATRKWTLPSANLTSLSLSANGSELGYVDQPLAGPVFLARNRAGAAWIMPTGAPPGNASDRGRKVFSDRRGASAESLVLSSDGTTTYLVTASSANDSPAVVTLAAYRSADGTILRTLHTWRNAQGYAPGVTIGGNQLLIWAIYQPSTFRVDLASGRVTPFWVFTPDGEFPQTIAW
jgi:hypothetical protein